MKTKKNERRRGKLTQLNQPRSEFEKERAAMKTGTSSYIV